MPTPNWSLFATAVAVLTATLLALSYTSTRAMAAAGVVGSSPGADDGQPPAGSQRPTHERPSPRPRPVPTGRALLANVLLTHGLLAAATLAVVWDARIPLGLVGLVAPTAESVAIGLGAGLGLYLASETVAALADRLGYPHDERLRALLAPAGPADWAVLLLAVLPTIAVAEELLFRGVLVGAVGAGFGLPGPALVVAAAALFGLGHTAQGGVGVAVTTALGVVLGVAFLWTGSLLAVALAHYVVDAMEFVIREGLLGDADPSTA